MLLGHERRIRFKIAPRAQLVSSTRLPSCWCDWDALLGRARRAVLPKRPFDVCGPVFKNSTGMTSTGSSNHRRQFASEAPMSIEVRAGQMLCARGGGGLSTRALFLPCQGQGRHRSHRRRFGRWWQRGLRCATQQLASAQLAGRGTKEITPTRMVVFGSS